jgi:alanyl-tRNA synthetase
LEQGHGEIPGGRVAGRSQIVEAVPVGDRHGLVVAETPFHPLDHTWPDQPADRGTIGGLPVLDRVTAARRLLSSPSAIVSIC